tara:strand:- start:7111 stop:7821 length:711 start_codon:yes stop_codon:yes gene_type:complete
MGILCIFGHSYSGIQRSEEKNEQGGEMVTTIIEYKKCYRCDEVRILSEYKEISVGSEIAAEPEMENAEPIVEPIMENMENQPIEESEENSEDTDKENTIEWVDEEVVEWPEATGEDEGFSANIPESFVENMEFGGGLIPKSLKEEEENNENVVEFPEREDIGLENDIGSEGDEDEAEESESARGRRKKDTQTAYVCKECEYQTPVYESALRKGDICPACRKGYIDEELIDRRSRKR